MNNTYDVIIIGSGPGGYVTAIRSSQLGFKTAVVEKAELGGICLNWGCIPTKSLMKSAQVFEYVNHSSEYGIEIEGNVKADFSKIIQRSRNVAGGMSKGVQFLLKKNKVDVLNGYGKIVTKGKVSVKSGSGEVSEYEAKHIILATGARSRELPNIPQDGKYIIGYREALSLSYLPQTMVVIGSGAIGSEFAYFYQTMGTKVTLVEYMPNIIPLEDEEVSKQLERNFKKIGIEVLASSSVENVKIENDKCVVSIKTSKETIIKEVDIVLSAVGIQTNLENIGLEENNIEVKNGKIVTNEFYKTNIEGIYAIGDIVAGHALAHVASAEGIICIENIAGLNPKPLDYNNIPACIYTVPEVASVGYTEKMAKEKGYEIKVGKFPFMASGKASAAGTRDGFIKLIFDAKYGELLGASMIGANVTEMISEIVVARTLETTGHEIIKSVHPHPTMSEAIMEAAAAAYGEVIHL